MKDHVARALAPLVANRQMMEALVMYVEERLDTLRKYNDNAQDIMAVRYNQGAIQELKNLEKLRDTVMATLPSKPATMVVKQAEPTNKVQAI